MSTSILGYERVYLPLGKVADTPFHIQGDAERNTREKSQLRERLS